MIARGASIAALGVALVAATPAQAELQVAASRLGNGLTVIVAPDPTASSVAVHVRYAFGSADQRPDEDGFAHLVQLLFAVGAPHVAAPDAVHFPAPEALHFPAPEALHFPAPEALHFPAPEALLDDAGGWTTTITATDHVGITDVVPAGALELALWIEADRMANLALDPERLERITAQLTAERASAYFDHPYGLVALAVQELLWFHEANATPVLGDARATVPALARFIRAHVAPAGATLVIAGRVEPARARALAERYFGSIPAGSAPRGARAAAPPLATAVAHQVANPVAKVVVAARSAAPYTRDDLAVELAGQIVAARLARRLGATAVHADAIRQAGGGELHVEVDAAANPDAIRDELQRLRDAPVDADELARARATLDARLISGLEALGFRAELLASWAAYTGRADRLSALRADRAAITPSELQRAAKHWLAASALVTVTGTGTP